MAKETVEQLVDGGKASPGPPLGPMLGPLGLNINDVIKSINEATKDFIGMKVPVKIIADTDTKKYTVEVGSPTTSALIKKEIGVEKISYAAEAPSYNATFEQVLKVARMKEKSMLANNFENAVREVIGTCVSSKIKIEGIPAKEFMKKFITGEFKEQMKNGSKAN